MSFHSLDTPVLLEILPAKLPLRKKQLTSSQDAIAALVHTAFVVLGFHLVAVEEDAPSRIYDNDVLPEDWNQHGPGNYTFKYKHAQSDQELLVKIIKMGNRLLINSVATQGEKAVTLDISVNDFTSPSFFPHDLTASDRPLVNGFVSTNCLDDFVTRFKLTTMREVIPGLPKEAYTEVTESDSSSRLRESESTAPARVQLEGPPHPDAPPNPPRGVNMQPPTNPLEIGRRDRDPFPSNPFAPPSLFHNDGGDGMFVGPDHPIFGAGMQGRGPDGNGPWGGDGYLPPLGAPPGARFDPVGPGIGPGASFPGRGRGGVPRRGGGPFGGQDPDFDDFPPPGSRDMFM